MYNNLIDFHSNVYIPHNSEIITFPCSKDFHRGGGWFGILRLFKSILFFVNWTSLNFFHILWNTNKLCLLLLYFDSDVIGRRDFFCSCPLCLFPCSRLSSFHLRLSLCLISFLLFPCVSVWENTRAWVPMSHSHTEGYLPFFAKRNSL